MIAEDAASPLAWRRMRSIVLEGFTADNTLPQTLAWPDGPLPSELDRLRHRSAGFRYSEACAHHWWQRYQAAPTAEEAYATWTLFVRSADRRAWVWVQRDVDSLNSADVFSKLKMHHVAINMKNGSRWLEEREKDLEKEFLGRQVLEGVGPWGKATL
jgi:hypothetical protein